MGVIYILLYVTCIFNKYYFVEWICICIWSNSISIYIYHYLNYLYLLIYYIRFIYLKLKQFVKTSFLNISMYETLLKCYHQSNQNPKVVEQYFRCFWEQKRELFLWHNSHVIWYINYIILFINFDNVIFVILKLLFVL